MRRKGVVGAVAAITIIIILVALVAIIFKPEFFYNLFSVTPWSFPLIITAGLLAFCGYYFAMKGKTHHAKLCFNGSVAVVFFGILTIEILIFGSFLTKAQIPYEKCTGETRMIDFLSCTITGYTLSKEVKDELWQWVSFWIFFIILPTAFVFSLVWGFLSPTNLLPQPAMRVIAFVISLYAARQVFGVFLLDLAAYGVWGVGGIIIPLLLSLMLKRVFDAFLGPAVVAEKTIYGMIGADLYSWIEDTRKKLDKIGDALKNEAIIANRGALENLKTELNFIKAGLDGAFEAINKNKNLPPHYKTPILAQISGERARVDMYLSQIESLLKKPVSS